MSPSRIPGYSAGSTIGRFVNSRIVGPVSNAAAATRTHYQGKLEEHGSVVKAAASTAGMASAEVARYGTRTAVRTWNAAWNPVVERLPRKDGTPGDKIVNPPFQAVMSGVHQNKRPFTITSAVMVAAAFFALWGMYKTGFNQQGDILAAYADSTVEALYDAVVEGDIHLPTALQGAWDLPSCNPKSIQFGDAGESCYPYMGNYIAAQKDNPTVEKIFNFFSLNGVDRHGLGILFGFLMATLGNVLMMSKYRQPSEVGKAEDLPWRQAAMWQGALFTIILGFNTLSQNAGFFQYMDHPTANFGIHDNWLNWAEVGLKGPNWDRIVAYWKTWGLMSIIMGTMILVTFNLADRVHVRWADFIHDFPYTKPGQLWGKAFPNGTLPGRVLRSIYKTIEPETMMQSEQVAVTKNGQPVLDDDGNPVYKTIMVPVIDQSTGEPYQMPRHLLVGRQVKANSPAEREAVLAGTHNPTFPGWLNKVSDAGTGALAGSIIGLGALGGLDAVAATGMIEGMDGMRFSPLVQDNPVFGVATAVVAATLTGLMVYAKINPVSDTATRLGTARTVLVSMFSPHRVGYWVAGAYFAIATFGNFWMSILSQTLQGYKITPFLLANTAGNSLVGGAWANRFFYGTYMAVTGRISSKYMMLIASYFVALFFGARAWTEQAVSQFYTPASIRYALTGDPETKSDYGDELDGYRDLLVDAMARTDDEDLFNTARNELIRARAADIMYVYPSLDEDDPLRLAIQERWEVLDPLLFELPKIDNDDPRREELEADYAALGFSMFGGSGTFQGDRQSSQTYELQEEEAPL